MASADTTAPQAMTTADGTPLKVSLNRAMRVNKWRAFFWVVPLLAFILITFLFPVADMMFRSVENSIVEEILPNTVDALRSWDETSGELPGEAVFVALHKDVLKGKETKKLGKVGRRLNFERSGVGSLFRGAPRKFKKITEAPYKEQILASEKKWEALDLWQLMKRESGVYTPSHFLAAVDMRRNDDSEVVRAPENRRIYIKIYLRTLWLSVVITGLCLLLGFPVSYLLATLPSKTGNLLLILVLLPFWTSLLVRTSAWIAILQQQGVLNDLLVWIGIIADDARIRMIHNQTGTIVAMTHILLPFMVLPLYSVMKTIPPTYMRAALSMGANPAWAFYKVYLPQTVAGIGAGGILVFIISIGYYITPALVGGISGTLISNFIADYMSSSALNWGLAGALGVILLGIVLVLYILYDKIVGIDNMKLG